MLIEEVDEIYVHAHVPCRRGSQSRSFDEHQQSRLSAGHVLKEHVDSLKQKVKGIPESLLELQ